MSLSADSSTISKNLKNGSTSLVSDDHQSLTHDASSSTVCTSSSSASSKKVQYHTMHHVTSTKSSNTTTSSLKKHLNLLRNNGKKVLLGTNPGETTQAGGSLGKASCVTHQTVNTAAIINTQHHQQQQQLQQSSSASASIIGSFTTTTSSTSPVSVNSTSSLSSKLHEYEVKINDMNNELGKYQQNRQVEEYYVVLEFTNRSLINIY